MLARCRVAMGEKEGDLGLLHAARAEGRRLAARGKKYSEDTHAGWLDCQDQLSSYRPRIGGGSLAISAARGSLDPREAKGRLGPLSPVCQWSLIDRLGRQPGYSPCCLLYCVGTA